MGGYRYLGEVILGLASHLPRSRDTDAGLARICGVSRVFALLPIFPMLLAPATVWGDIYKWTDERGNMVVSNVQPVDPGRVSDVELLATEPKPATQSPVASSQQAAIRTEQAPEARIESLEHQLQTQQYAQPPQVVPQPTYSGGYYPTPAPPPPVPIYYASYYPGYYPVYYSGYYYPWPLSYSPIVFPVRPFVRRPGSLSPPAFVNRPALGFSRGVSFGGGSMPRGRR